MMDLLIRADGSQQIGIGHLMRCLALAQGWRKRGGRVFSLSHCEGFDFQQLAGSEGVEFISIKKPYPDPLDPKFVLSTIERLAPSWVVIDGYHFDLAYQKLLRETGTRVLLIDDFARLPRYDADVFLNQNINAAALTYHAGPDTNFLLGTDYALLRAEFLSWQNWEREIPDRAGKLLITMGGGDRSNVTLKIIHALRQLNPANLEVKIVIGPANPHTKELQQAVSGLGSGFELLNAVSDLPGLMAWADMAVSAGGSTCWELAFMGLPNVVLVLAENQNEIARGLAEAGVALNLGAADLVAVADIGKVIAVLLESQEQRRRMSRLGRELIDGNGVARVIEVLQSHPTLAKSNHAHTVSGK